MPIDAIVDFRKVQAFLFESSHLAYIRGASRWLWELNRFLLPELVEKHDGDPLIKDGGLLLASFPSMGAAEAFANEARNECEPHIGVAIALRERGSSESFPVARKALLEKLEKAKLGAGHFAALCTNSYIMRCSECGFRAANKNPATIDVPICATCFKKWEHSGRRQFCLEPIENLTELGKLARPQNYLATVLIDLDHLGRQMDDFAERGQDAYVATSNALARAFVHAIQVACLKACQKKRGDRTARFEICYVGGDDGMLVLPGDRVFEFVGWFETEFKRRCLRGGIAEADVPRFSVGFLLANSHFPIREAFAISDELCKSAKTLKEGNSVDWAVLTDSMADRVVERRTHFKDGVVRTGKPYTTQAFLSLETGIRALRELGASTSKLKALYKMSYEAPEVARLEYRHLLTRVDRKVRLELKNTVGVDIHENKDDSTVYTKAPDMVELMDFVR